MHQAPAPDTFDHNSTGCVDAMSANQCVSIALSDKLVVGIVDDRDIAFGEGDFLDHRGKVGRGCPTAQSTTLSRRAIESALDRVEVATMDKISWLCAGLFVFLAITRLPCEWTAIGVAILVIGYIIDIRRIARERREAAPGAYGTR
jgi:hypothetical protein